MGPEKELRQKQKARKNIVGAVKFELLKVKGTIGGTYHQQPHRLFLLLVVVVFHVVPGGASGVCTRHDPRPGLGAPVFAGFCRGVRNL